MAGRLRQEAQQRVQGLLGYFTSHGTAANLLLILMIAAGFAAAPQMRAQFFPDVVVDEIDIDVTWDGAGPEDVDRAIIEPLLPAVLAVEGIIGASSRARDGRASIEIEFEPGWNADRAMRDLESAVGSVTTLPEDAETPEISESVWRDRVTDVVITGPVGVEQLGRFADEFTAKLFQAGVTRTTVRGYAAPQTVVEVRSLDLMRYDVTMAEIAEVIAGAAETDPAGDVAGANARVRTGVPQRAVQEVASVPLRVLDDGSTLTIGDLARVYDPGIDRERAYFVGENPALSIRVDRSPQGDAIAIQHKVEEVAAEFETILPPEVQIDLIRTRAEAISQRLNILTENGLTGLALVVILLFLFLNARTAIWVAAGIPVAMLAALALMYVAGFTLNMISLFGLIITLGIVVDDAIVVGEHADYRRRKLGEPAQIAAGNAARRMFLPVFTATITTVIAFFGLTFIGGRFGEMIADIPFTVIVVLLASLVECFLILPNHMAHALAKSTRQAWYDWPSEQVNRGFDWIRDHGFRPFVGWVITLRYPVVAAALMVLALSWTLVISGQVSWRFFNPPERSSISGNFAMLPGASREDTFDQMREIQRATETVAARFEAEHGRNPLVYVLSEVGGNTGRGLASAANTDADLLGSIAIELVGSDDRPYSVSAFLSAVQEEVTRLPLTETLSFRSFRFGPGRDGVAIQLYGADLRQLKAASEALKERLGQIPEISAVEDNLAYDKDEYVLDLTAKGHALGFTIDELGRALRNRLNGIEAATYPSGLRTASIRVEMPDGEKTADFLTSMLMRTDAGEYVPLTDLVTVSRSTGFGEINRINDLPILEVSGDLDQENASRATEIMEQIETELLPELQGDFEVSYQIAGLAEQERGFLSDAKYGFLLCLLGIFLALAWIFASWTRPLAIMAIIPFGLVGALWGHYFWEVPLSMFSIVGLIGMTGIIINDSIVLITTVDEEAQSRGLVPAIIDGTAQRLRPVLLTTLTTVLGLAPLLFERSRDAQFLKPTVVTLTYGLGVGMVLVLVLVPALLAIGQDLGQALRGLRRGFRFGAGPVRLMSFGLALVFAAWGALTLGMPILTQQSPLAAAFGLPQTMTIWFGSFAFGVILAGLVAFAVTAGAISRKTRRAS